MVKPLIFSWMLNVNVKRHNEGSPRTNHEGEMNSVSPVEIQFLLYAESISAWSNQGSVMCVLTILIQ